MRRRQMYAEQQMVPVRSFIPDYAPPIVTEQRRDPNACPKCGKVIGQGRYMHVKHCKG